MTESDSSIPFAGSQANIGPSAGPPFPEPDRHSGHDVGDPTSGTGFYSPQWAVCVSTRRALGHEAGAFVRQLANWLVDVIYDPRPSYGQRTGFPGNSQPTSNGCIGA